MSDLNSVVAGRGTDEMAAMIERLRASVRALSQRPVGPYKCPFTGRPFWGNVEHPDHGDLATYGGPHDTYTLPERTDEDPSYTVLRCDHDLGVWVDGAEDIGMALVDDQLYTSEEDPAELRRQIDELREQLARHEAHQRPAELDTERITGGPGGTITTEQSPTP